VPAVDKPRDHLSAPWGSACTSGGEDHSSLRIVSLRAQALFTYAAFAGCGGLGPALVRVRSQILTIVVMTGVLALGAVLVILLENV
jgi:hypothetical protein